MDILRVLGLRTPKVADAESFRRFQGEQAVFVTQKFAYGYCRARVGRAQEKIMFEDAFNRQMEVCRWEGAAAMLSDMMVLAEHRLRPHAHGATEGAALRDALIASYGLVLDRQGLPGYRRDWADAKEAFARRMEEVRTAEPQDMLAVTRHSWDVIFDRLPIAEKIRQWDREQVYQSFRLWLVRYVETLDGSLDAPATAGSLLAEGRATDGTAAEGAAAGGAAR